MELDANSPAFEAFLFTVNVEFLTGTELAIPSQPYNGTLVGRTLDMRVANILGDKVVASLLARTALLSAMIGLACAHVQAVPAESTNDLAALSLEELSEIRVETVYGASKHVQTVAQAPSSVSIVTLDDIKKSGYRTLGEVLNHVRGMYSTYDYSYTYGGVRGFNRPGDYGGRLLLMVDGHRINDPIYDFAMFGQEFLLDVDLIERVEVIRGPGSSLYGNNAFFGVINVITRKGAGLRGAEVSGSYGTFDSWTGRVTYGNLFTNGIELLISGSLYDSQGDSSLFFPEFEAFDGGWARDIDGSRAWKGFGTLSYNGFSLSGGYVTRKKNLPTAAYGAIFNDSGEFIRDDRGYGEFKFLRELEDETQVSARLYYDRYYYEGRTPLPEFGYDDPAYPGARIDNWDKTESDTVGGELQLSRPFGEKHRATAGIEYRRDLSLKLYNADIDPPAVYLNEERTGWTFGGYLQDEYAVMDKVVLNLGLRYDYFDSCGGTLNPRAAIIYNPWTNSTIKALYGQAFRAPNAYEMYYESTDYAPNPHLDPETIRSYELVLEQRIGRNFRASGSIFYNDIHDLISFETLPGDTYFFQNLDEAVARGFEAEIDARFAGGWKALASYTFTDAYDSQSDKELSDSPRHLAKLNCTAPIWSDRVFGTLEFVAFSSRRTVAGSRLAPECLANFTLFSQKIVQGLEVSASVYNLFDVHYNDPAGDDFAQDSIEQAGRTFRVKMTYRF
jgi:iron complex outermembrane receptor protein